MVRNQDALKRTAIHESGHVLVASLTPGAHPVGKATIIPRGQALGFTSQVSPAVSLPAQQVPSQALLCPLCLCAEAKQPGSVCLCMHPEFLVGKRSRACSHMMPCHRCAADRMQANTLPHEHGNS